MTDRRPFDPTLFGDREEITAGATRFCNDLRATKPVDPVQRVNGRGDPVGPGLVSQIRQIAQACAAPWLSP
jgi:hypothetical protein